MPLIRERLEAGAEVTFSPRGGSMLPLLHEGRDTVTLAAPPKKLKKYDIPLYQRENGQYVLHRVVRVGRTYTCIGDNQFAFEEGITHGQVIAVCVSFMRNDKKVSVSDPLYRLYSIFWHYSRFPRRIILAALRRMKRLWGKISSKKKGSD
jgi:hypothetical protein